MPWTNLPTDYTDAVFTGLRRYVQIENEDNTVSFHDVTVYENKEKSFFGANDANRMNAAINEIMNSTSTAPSMAMDQITLQASAWVSQGDYHTQTVTLADVKANERIDLNADAVVLNQLMNDNVGAMYIENNEGVLTAYSIGGVPTADLTIQVSRVGIPSVE